ncbi:MAG: glucosamine-6-phosphate deaminase [Thiotrichales bacterium]|nr:glucosamine-6-phosphate deaminase [Thiotrichales bacterium]
MRVVILPTEKEASHFAADFIEKFITEKNNSILGLATGSSVLLTYAALIEKYNRGDISFKKVITFNLDEYIGLEPNHKQSYRYYMSQKLFGHIDINENNIHIPECLHGDFESTCRYYESKIKNYGGIDLQLLGVGSNGHIGFNEPTSSLKSRTRVKTLTKNTIINNARFFDESESQPSIAITMGIGTIMEAKNILLLGLGQHKSKAVADLVEGPLSSFCPGSVLQNHENAIVVLDQLAASSLKLYDYYIHSEKMNVEYMC